MVDMDTILGNDDEDMENRSNAPSSPLSINLGPGPAVPPHPSAPSTSSHHHHSSSSSHHHSSSSSSSSSHHHKTDKTKSKHHTTHHTAKEPKEEPHSHSSGFGAHHRTHNGTPPTFGSGPGADTSEGDDSRFANGRANATTYQGGEGWQPEPAPQSAWIAPAGHQSTHVRALNHAQLTYPWHLPLLAHASLDDTSVPVEFDWRTQPGAPPLTPVQDQGACGSCWAFASSQSLADRMRIAKKTSPLLSAEYVKNCGTSALGARYDQLLDLGQNGATGTCGVGACLAMGCEFLASYGAVSSSVQPYSSETALGQDAGSCLAPDVAAGETLYTAKAGSVALITLGPNGHAPASHAAMSSAHLSASVVAQNVTNMQKNILLYGPLAVTTMCYKDLCTADFDSANYVDNVYVPDISSGEDGGHAMTIVGWGVGATQRTPYWIVRNSWGGSWNASMGGYYLHVRGTNAAQIESGAISIQPGDVGGGRPVTGSDVMQSERRRINEADKNASFWTRLSSLQRLGLVTGLASLAVVIVAVVIALVVYSRDKGFGWLRS